MVEPEIAALRDEVERLRRLVGPSEVAYAELADDVMAASDLAKQSEADAGALRGQVAELQAALAGATQVSQPPRPTTRLRSYAARLIRSIRSRFS